MKLTLSPFFVCAVLLSSYCTIVSYAQAKGTPAAKAKPSKKQKKKTPAATPLDEAMALDAWKEATYRDNHFTPYQKLKIAQTALEQSKYPQAMKQAGLLFEDPDTVDHALWIHTQAFLAQAYSPKYKLKADAIQGEISLLEKYIHRQPYTPFEKTFLTVLGQCENLLGRSHAKAKKTSSALKAFHVGFQRLSQNSELRKITQDDLESYLGSCKANKDATLTSLCDAWVTRLARWNSKNSNEFKMIKEKFADLATQRPPSAQARLTATYPQSTADSENYEASIESCLKKDRSDCREKMNAFLKDYPKSSLRFRARSWIALMYERDNDQDHAKKEWEQILKESPYGFYGVLAAQKLSKTPQSNLNVSGPQVVATDPFLRPAEVFRLQRARRFLAEHLESHAAHELAEIRPKPEYTNSFLFYLTMLQTQARAHQAAFGILTELLQRGAEGTVSIPVSLMIFPETYLDEIEAAAKAKDLDPMLLLSIVKQESAFDPNAMSSSGAQGLTQIMAATATDRDANVSRGNQSSVNENLRLGADYLKHLLTRFDQNFILAVAAYNAGPTAVARWVRSGKAKDGWFEFIEQIPYRETRDYVTSVVRNYYWYSQRIKGEPVKIPESVWKQPGEVTATPDAGETERESSGNSEE